MTAQQLVEQRAVRVGQRVGLRTGGCPDASGDLQQFDAITDVHHGDRAALGGEDDRDAGQRLLPALQPDPAPGACQSADQLRTDLGGARDLGVIDRYQSHEIQARRQPLTAQVRVLVGAVVSGWLQRARTEQLIEHRRAAFHARTGQ